MMLRPLLALALVSSPLLAQTAPDPLKPVAIPSVPTDASRNAVLRGISQIYLEVAITEGGTPGDSELRSELRDAVELELRRAGITLRESSPTDTEARSPLLRMEVKFDRGAGRFAARLNMGVRDQVMVTRSRETITAEIWNLERSASSPVDTGLSREIRSRARDMTADFISALRRANGVR